MSACFLQLSARNIHLFIYYFDILQTGEGFDNIYKLKGVNGSKTLRDQVTTSCGFLLQYYFLRLFSVTNHKKRKTLQGKNPGYQTPGIVENYLI